MGRYLIETPVRGASTDIGDVHFHQGKAEMDEVPQWLRQYCEQQGYSITDTAPPSTVDEADDAEVGDDDGDPLTAPRGNASADAWREHVLALGGTEDQVADLNRDQLRELAAELAKEGGLL